MTTFRQDVRLGTKVPLMKTDDYNDKSVTTPKLADSSVTTEKLADDSITASKLSKGAIEEIAKEVDISVIENEDIDFIMNKNELI